MHNLLHLWSLSRESLSRRSRADVTAVRRTSKPPVNCRRLNVTSDTPAERTAYLPNYVRSSHGPWVRMQITRTSSCRHELSTIHRALNCSCCRRYCRCGCCRCCCCCCGCRCWCTIHAAGSCKSSASDFEDFVAVRSPDYRSSIELCENGLFYISNAFLMIGKNDVKSDLR